jgi:hypothetical protein
MTAKRFGQSPHAGRQGSRKKAAKIVARLLGLPLSVGQAAIARSCGYQDWHDFELNHAKDAPFALDHHLGRTEYVALQTQLILALATEAGVSDGDAQFALAHSRLTGDRPASLTEQIASKTKGLTQRARPRVTAWLMRRCAISVAPHRHWLSSRC